MFTAIGWWLLLVAGGLVLRAVSNIAVAGRDFEPSRQLVAAAVSLALMAVVAIGLFGAADVSGRQKLKAVRERSRTALRTLGCIRAPAQLGRDVVWGVAAGAVIFVLSVALTWLVPWPPIDGATDPRVAYVGPNGAVGRVIIGVLYGPPLEEAFWRGGLLLIATAATYFLHSSRSARVVIVILLVLISLSFGWSHLNFSVLNAATATVMGLVCGAAALGRRSLIPALIAHALLNTAVLLFSFAR